MCPISMIFKRLNQPIPYRPTGDRRMKNKKKMKRNRCNSFTNGVSHGNTSMDVMMLNGNALQKKNESICFAVAILFIE